MVIKNNETDCKLQKAYDEMRDSYLQLKEQYSNLFKENQRLKDAGHTYEGKHDQDPPKSEHSVFAVRMFGLFEPKNPTSEQQYYLNLANSRKFRLGTFQINRTVLKIYLEHNCEIALKQLLGAYHISVSETMRLHMNSAYKMPHIIYCSKIP